MNMTGKYKVPENSSIDINDFYNSVKLKVLHPSFVKGEIQRKSKICQLMYH